MLTPTPPENNDEYPHIYGVRSQTTQVRQVAAHWRTAALVLLGLVLGLLFFR